MFKAESYNSRLGSIPSQWIFQRYLRIEQPLEGQSLRFQSIYNPKDKTPSMFIYFNKRKQDYRFKCFSTGKMGDGFDLLKEMWQISYWETVEIIEKDYARELSENGAKVALPEMKDRSWQVTHFEVRQWNKNDAEYYSAYNISSQILEHYGVRPLKSFVLQQANGNNYTTEGEFIYGYFNLAGKLCKIYQPMVKSMKFIKVAKDEDRYVQGYEQLEGHSLLLIMASLKDTEAMKSLGLPADGLAPDSENSFLPDWIMEIIRPRYRYIIVMLDNDDAGKKMMRRWKEEKGIDYLLFEHEKDLADAVKVHGATKVRSLLTECLNQKLAA